ncbi:flagellar motor switch protein FliG [Terriglobus roseus DSM 18391]|uniref:Flagellar motor switch protein FliG n=1 Tax=Terriglobus roseus (strain DSM 18391 / NRRL B-41598 / KBS 63) TaxID=926566 RepID=I3ZFV2_TERRK|nr:flagellar motor switch protein FliG [Terriglobus roseus]AFL88120.1 flagellar motor switch protein FliG [Terriglobus roseus DSM 18391]
MATASTTLAATVPPMPAVPALTIAPLRKAAILIMTLGEQASKVLLRGLGEGEVQRLTEELSRVGDISPEEQTQVLLEFYSLQETQQYILRGGPDYAQRLLLETFGRQRADELLRDISRIGDRQVGDLAALQKMDPAQVSKFLEGEHPQTVALVLAHLNPKRGSAVLMALPEDLRVEAVRRLAEMRQFSPEMAQRVAMILYKRIHALGSNGRQSYAGFKAVAELLNRMEGNASRSILESIEQQEPTLAIGIRNLMFTFEDLLNVPASSIRELVSAAEKRVLALALKSADDTLRMHLFAAMSSRAVEMLQEDMETLGPVRGRDVAQAQQDLLSLARRLETEGKMILKMEADGDFAS